MECNQSLCCFCDLNFHNDKSHTLTQLSKFAINQNNMDKIKSIFEKQKNFFEKIKKINNNLMQSLENDIQIKERIINNYNENKFNYNSFLNMNNLFFHNNERYESIRKYIIKK